MWKAAERKQADAQYWFGRALLGDNPQKKVKRFKKLSYKDGVEYLRKASKQGHSEAMSRYGSLLITGGYGVTVDQEEGQALIDKTKRANLNSVLLGEDTPAH